jgi:hypothetical protein
MPQHNVHHGGTLTADLTPTAATLVPKADAVVLQLQELLIELQQFFRAQVSFGKQLLLSVGENLLPVAHDLCSEAATNSGD